jgi:hypothetical protein
MTVMPLIGPFRKWSPTYYSRDTSVIFGETRRSKSSFAKASEDTRYAFLHGFAAVASCEGGCSRDLR